VNGPERKTGKAIVAAVNYTTTESAIYLAFPDFGDAEDAYAYFLYHNQVGH